MEESPAKTTMMSVLSLFRAASTVPKNPPPWPASPNRSPGAEIEELYGRPRFTHDERVHYFALTPEGRAVADGHYSLASRVLFILQAGYFKAKTLFFSFEIDEVADDVKHVLQQHYPVRNPKGEGVRWL